MKEEVATKRLLSLVLCAVLVWYTFVNPSDAPAQGFRGNASDAEGRDLCPEEGAGKNEWVRAGPGEEYATPKAESCPSVDDLDWPEIIGIEQ